MFYRKEGTRVIEISKFDVFYMKKSFTNKHPKKVKEIFHSQKQPPTMNKDHMFITWKLKICINLSRAC